MCVRFPKKGGHTFPARGGGKCGHGTVNNEPPLIEKDLEAAQKWLEKAVQLYDDANGESRLSEDVVKDAERRIAEIDQVQMQE